MNTLKCFLVFVATLACTAKVQADDEAELARKLQNPVANLISVRISASDLRIRLNSLGTHSRSFRSLANV